MSDLISRSALKKAIMELPNDNPSYYYTSDLLERVIQAIDNAPTVNFIISPDYVTELKNLNKELIKQLEEAERPKGEWIKGSIYGNSWANYGFKFRCSLCEREQTFSSNFCPNCGAKMEKEAENDIS